MSILRRTIQRCFILLILVALFANSISAEEKPASNSMEDRPVLYYFWGYCPLCDHPTLHLEGFEAYPIEIQVLEVVYNEDNRERYHEMRAEYDIKTIVFPTIIFNGQYWLGYSHTIEVEINKAIEAALYQTPVDDQQNILVLPLIGEVDLFAAPILISTILISFMDGFNPCSLFVLAFLLAIIVHSASRKRVFLVGITFLIVTTIVYGLFIIGVLNIMVFAAQLFWIRNIVAAMVIVLGLVSIKDFFFFQQGLSFSIPERYKAKYYKQVRQIFFTKSAVPMLAATAVTAMGIALIELPCTAGFPFIWSSIMAGLELPLSQYVALLALYLLIYLSIELVIFILAVVKLRALKITEEGGRFLKLVAGSFMLVLGLVLLLKPEYMDNIPGLLMAFGTAALVVALMYLVRRLLVRA